MRNKIDTVTWANNFNAEWNKAIMNLQESGYPLNKIKLTKESEDNDCDNDK